MKSLLCIILLALPARGVFSSELKRQPWDRYERDYQSYDSVAMLVIEYGRIKKIKVGMSFAEVERITGVAPTDYYIHPNFALLATRIEGETYWVALLHKKGPKVLGISYRKAKLKDA